MFSCIVVRKVFVDWLSSRYYVQVMQWCLGFLCLSEAHKKLQYVHV